jgi:RsiW-degrading membrane proteinase PrsW (M82 family)
MGLILSGAIGFGSALLFAYILYWLDRYEKEPILLLGGVFLWGVVVAAGTSFLVNTMLGIGVYVFTGSDAATEFTTGSIIAPLVEESLKGLAVLGVFAIFRREFDSILDGIIYAGVAALGFAATENTYYIYAYGYQEGGFGGLAALSFVRVILVGWQHPFYTAFIGIGLAAARLSRHLALRIAAPLLGLGLAMFTHAFHNTMAGLFAGLPTLEGLAVGVFFDWSGWLFMLVVIVWATWREQRNLRRHLWAEVNAGTISQGHYWTAVSAWKQSSARLAALFSGRYLRTARFFQVCGELAHKREQALKLGDEGGNAAIIQNLRVELAGLAPSVRA